MAVLNVLCDVELGDKITVSYEYIRKREGGNSDLL